MHQRINVSIPESNILYFSKSKIDESFTPSFHSHQNLELILITEGEGKIISSFKKINVKKGDIVVINPNSRHYEEGLGLAYYAIGIRNFEMYLKETFTKKIIVRELDNSVYSSIFNLYNIIYDEALKNDSFSNKIITSSTNIIFDLLDRTYNFTSHKNESAEESDIVSNIKLIINTYYSSNITLNQISHRLSESKSTICHKFKSETGYSIIEYKINKQLEEARNMIAISDMSISNIAYLTGFASAAYFTKSFKQKYNCSPKEYRDKLKSKR